ncbi:trypsin-like peptidase domain-containing protein [Spongisporangium articulatum]|uniref:Trypsin-like peptidase domain-containing protein n=1 Tax=Spongisporangium articulatum TaxID=3362603 RepID=A0ABW8ARB0_9ACTN
MSVTVRRLLAVAALLAVGALGSPALAATPAPSAPTAVEVNAATEPSIVQLAIRWRGYIYYETVDGYVWTQDVVTAYAGCTGFFVTTDGHITTAGHCVERKFGREALIETFLSDQVDQGLITSSEAADLLDGALINWKAEGLENGSAIERKVVAYQPKGLAGAPLADDSETARVLDTKPFDEGDTALLKIEATDTPALPVATVDPKTGSELTAIGFPGSVGKVVDVERLRASFKSGTASSQQVSEGGVPQTEVNADISPGMSGGPTIDPLGNVLGVNSFKIVGEDQNFNFITDTTDLRDWLQSKNLTLVAVKTPPAAVAPAATRLPSTASDDGLSTGVALGLIAGGLVVLAGLIALVVAVTRAKPAPAAAAPGGPAVITLPDAGTPVTPPAPAPAPVVPAPIAEPEPVATQAVPASTPTQPMPAEAPATVTCPNGHEVPAGQAFCGTCGAKITD